MILVTGGAGFIGSHVAVEFITAGHEVVIVDSLVNSSAACVKGIEQITGEKINFEVGDLCDLGFLSSIFLKYKITGVIHFAALKSVAESCEKPIEYYYNNINGLINLIRAMNDASVFKLIFSSSATVYGDPNTLPIRETDETGGVSNPYGSTKYIAEEILFDLAKFDPRWSITLLRYFNPAGAHKSALIGEYPKSTPTNLMPILNQVAAGLRSEVTVFGSDYATRDGTGIRDYIHVVDLAIGHLRAWSRLESTSGIEVFNLGTGGGVSVLEAIRAVEAASGAKIAFTLAARRRGDVAECVADPSKANATLGWTAKFNLADMAEDGWQWQQKCRRHQAKPY